ncbi:MAG: YbaB/EbfC family nucleoid-associated protein [Bdellovibrionales bacterium]|nr:YbaB/EbfC family nucleoid-associated protein [Bdellovibrionales bacterium]
MKGFGGGMQQLMRQANQMQNKIKKLQEELATREFEGTSGGNAVKVTVNGSNQLMAIQIDPEVFKEGDAEMLQDLILTAANDALKTAKEISDGEMSKITGGFNFPGGF